jgi:uncharacterized protein (DUF58 family)
VTGRVRPGRVRPGRVRPGRVRPGRPLAPIPVALAIVATWWLVAHSSGVGWVQALGDIVFGTLAVGILAPGLLLWRTTIAVTASPPDATTGMPVEVSISASSRVRVRCVAPHGAESWVGPVRAGRDRAGRDRAGRDRAGRNRAGPDRGCVVTLVPPRRGVYTAIVVDAATAAPFGIQWWTRRVRLALAAPLHVAPRRGEPLPLPPRPYDRWGERAPRSPAQLGELRAVRPYRPGDQRRQVHWPATAHAGQMMVTDAEAPSAAEVRVTVRLPADADRAERAASRALGTVASLLERGNPVVLATTEPSGEVVSVVADRTRAGRRLARAVPSPGDGDGRGGVGRGSSGDDWEVTVAPWA